MFLNYVNKKVSVNTYRNCNAVCTTLEDIQDAIKNNRDENLTADINDEDESYFL